MNPIYLLGATDRFNYGDLLFPHILTIKINEYAKSQGVVPDIRNYSLQQSDLSNIGALPTSDYKKFYHEIKHGSTCNVIIVGGEVLGTNWLILYSFLSPFYDRLYKKIPGFAKRYLMPLISCVFIRPLTSYPFILHKRQFDNIVCLAYNSVGGIIASKRCLSYLRSADNISVRSTYAHIYFNQKNIPVSLCPDSAIIMEQIWSKRQLYQIKSASLILPETYIFFQINNTYSNGKIKKIAEILDNIYYETKLPIVLCPIGLALGHEDDIALKQIHDFLTVPTLLISKPNLWDIMYAIASSTLYIGTSLHGIITAMSYDVPYIGLLRSNKIGDYLETWAIDPLKAGATIDTLKAMVNEIYKMDLSSLLSSSSTKMKRLVNESLYKICSSLK